MRAQIVLNHEFQVADVKPALFGSFVEHLGRCVYGGIFEPEHPKANQHGFRQDVLDAVKDLGVTCVRYPGGNFVSGYRWEDGVGPKEKRPNRLDLAWHSLETNEVGLDEFMAWAELADVEPIMAVNLGTAGLSSAISLAEYCNVPGGTATSQWRADNGHPEPYRIEKWCLGNEMDGPWQIGHKSAQEYGRSAAETARAMRRVDGNLKFVVCGSSNSGMPTFGKWEYDVLQECFEEVDYISAHSYYEQKGDDLASFLASGVDLDGFLDSVAATVRAVAAQKRSQKRIGISLDEWNVWYQSRESEQVPKGDDWPVAPHLLEDTYTVADAVVVGGLLISILRHSDVVDMACQAQLVNVIAPIRTEPGGKLWYQTIYHPFKQVANLAKGVVLDTRIQAPSVMTEAYGECAAIDAVGTFDGETEVLFMVNRDPDQAIEVQVSSGFDVVKEVLAESFFSDDPYWSASAADDQSVLPRGNQSVKAADNKVTITLPATSWTVLRIK